MEVEVRALKLIAQDTVQLINEWNRLMVLKNETPLDGEIDDALSRIKEHLVQHEHIINLIKNYAGLVISQDVEFSIKNITYGESEN